MQRRDRHLDWDGCCNARDLGGLPTVDGRETLWGALARSESPDLLTAQGWSAVTEHGIRTIIDLRNDTEISHAVPLRPPRLPVIRRSLDAAADKEFWERWATRGQYGTPVYYRPFLEHFPRRVVHVLDAIAAAPSGGVLVHCAQGRDRTGLITVVLLSLAGVGAEDIAADYVLSTHRLSSLFTRLGQPDQGPAIQAYLTSAGTSAEEVITSMLAALDIESLLRSAGLGDEALTALRARLLGS